MALNVDNDLYFGTDRYYSSGIFFEFGSLKKVSSDSLSKWSYVSKNWRFGQEINTPALGQTESLLKMDYPYNGWLFLGFKKELFIRPDLGYGWGIQFGTTGADLSLAKFFQNTYHIHILNLEPLTWAWSIPQAFHINFNSSIFLGKRIVEKIKWVNTNQIQTGTFRTSVQSRFGLQFGSLPGLPFFGNRLEELKNGFAIFLGMKLEYSFHDFSLSGSLFKSSSPFSLKPFDFRNTYQTGIVFLILPWKANFMLNNSSRYIVGQKYKRHSFLNISLGYIF